MKELIENIWDMPMWELLLLLAIPFVLWVVWMLYIFKKSDEVFKERKQRRNVMKADFERMETRINRKLGD